MNLLLNVWLRYDVQDYNVQSMISKDFSFLRNFHDARPVTDANAVSEAPKLRSQQSGYCWTGKTRGTHLVSKCIDLVNLDVVVVILMPFFVFVVKCIFYFSKSSFPPESWPHAKDLTCDFYTSLTISVISDGHPGRTWLESFDSVIGIPTAGLELWFLKLISPFRSEITKK